MKKAIISGLVVSIVGGTMIEIIKNQYFSTDSKKSQIRTTDKKTTPFIQIESLNQDTIELRDEVEKIIDDISG